MAIFRRAEKTADGGSVFNFNIYFLKKSDKSDLSVHKQKKNFGGLINMIGWLLQTLRLIKSCKR